MTDIPADILKAAEAAFKRDEHDNTLIRIVARAILAERQRCMRKINEEANGVTDEAVLVYALQVQRTIAGEVA